jgi:hypothetical protein
VPALHEADDDDESVFGLTCLADTEPPSRAFFPPLYAWADALKDLTEFFSTTTEGQGMKK